MEGQEGPGGSAAPADMAAGPASAGAEADGLWVPDEYVEVRRTQRPASSGVASAGCCRLLKLSSTSWLDIGLVPWPCRWRRRLRQRSVIVLVATMLAAHHSDCS